MTTRCLIVEDEPLAAERLAEYVGRLPLLELVGTVDSAEEAFARMKSTPVDLVFLDINLGGWSGMDLLETRSVSSRVVLTTAHPEFAARAYDLDVADYLVKPFTFERFVQAVDRARESSPRESRDFIFVKTELRLERVALDEILFIEGQRDYRRIHTTRKRIMTLETFGELERRLPADVICRVHKSYMVRLDRIDSIEQGRIRIGELEIPISDTYRDRFFALIASR